MIIDTNTSYQPYTVEYYTLMKKYGVASNFIKVSEGVSFICPNWQTSYNNTKKSGLLPRVYHFLLATNVASAINEANFFAKQLKAFGLDGNVKYMIDAESNNTTQSVLAFYQRMKELGYLRATTYSYKAMFLNRLDSRVLPRPWVASYSLTNDLGISNAQAWQYSNTFKGYSQDISKDLSNDLWFTTDNFKTKEVDSMILNEAVRVIANEVIKGKFGNDSERKENIYKLIQNEVNRILK